MRIGKPTRATRSKAAVAASAPATVSASTEEVDKTNSTASAKSEEDAAGSAPSGAAVAATEETSAGDQEQISEVRRTPRKRSQTKLYDAVEAAGGGSTNTKRQKRSARLASKERGCPNPWRDEDEPDEEPPEPVTEEAPPTIEAGHGKSAIHLSGKNMASWNNLRKEFGVKSDDEVFERLRSFVKPGLTKKTAKPDLR